MRRAKMDNSDVQLEGQGTRSIDHERGYAMAALLVGLSVMAVLMSVALPVWNKQAQRDREEEYLFRAREYARGVMKFQQKSGPGTLPPSLDVLVQQRFVRRKYKDPLSGQDFNPVYQTATALGQPGAGGAIGSATPGQIGTGFGAGTGTSGSSTSTTATQTSNQGAPVPGAGVMGVVSKSKATSIKVYNGRTRYDQWAVTYQDIKPGKGLPPDILQAMNQPGGATAQPGGLGQPGQGAANPFGGSQPGAKPGPSPFGQPGANPFGQPGGNPFGQPGASPFGQPGAGGAPGANPFRPAYPPPPGGGGQPPFGPPRKSG
jgi:type II secretory pathway pseudopilin PulG